MTTYLPHGRRPRSAFSALAALVVVLLASLLLAAAPAAAAAAASDEQTVESDLGDRLEAAPVIGGVPQASRGPVEDAARGAGEPTSTETAPGQSPDQATAAPARPDERISLADGDARLAAFAGLSTWIDLYDTQAAPADQAALAAASGVQTIFVQSARYSSPADVHDPARLGTLIEAAHDLGLKVVTWYIPDHLDVELDLRRSQAAIDFTSPRGDRADAFGLDIETEHQTDVTERSRQLLELSQRLREAVGSEYPMAAIVLPPLQLDLRPDWWPDFPYAELAASYDVVVPMSYSSFRGTDAATTYNWNLANVTELRARAGDPDLPVHLAGGIADDLPELGAFARAAADGDVLGAGLYDLQTTRADAWPELQALRAER